jgi:putative membrane protein
MRARIAWILTLGSLAVPAFAADETFFHEAARAGLAEVALGKLAATKGSSERVKAFGQQMVAEHEAANARLKAAAAESNVTLPADLAADARATQQKLESLSGNAFDQAYTESQARAHARTIDLLEKQIEDGSDAAAKGWARETLPTMQRHAETIGSLDARPPGEHHVEHAVGTAGPADAPPGTAPPR